MRVNGILLFSINKDDTFKTQTVNKTVNPTIVSNNKHGMSTNREFHQNQCSARDDVHKAIP